MSSRIVGNYRSARARGASVPTPNRSQQRFFALFGKLVLLTFSLAVVSVIAYGVKEAYIQINSQRISTVQIDGSMNFVSRAEIEAAVQRFMDTSMVALDLDALKQELEFRPWVSNAAVRRQWPDRLVISIEEELAVARWGDRQLLNQQGKVFTPDSIDRQLQLPYLDGPEGSELEVMQQYQQFNQLLYPLGVKIRDLELNERKAWTIAVTDSSLGAAAVLVEVKVGREDVLDRMRRLVTFLQSDNSRFVSRMRRIDLRYGNGLAVAYKNESLLPGSGADRSSVEGLVAR